LGPNGAGKTTTIKILSTLLEPSGGRAVVGGSDVVRDPDQVRRQIGIIFQDPSLDDRLTAIENLRFHAALYGVPREQTEGRIASLLELMGLSDRAKSPTKTFSGGMKRRLEVARALLHVPRILILDEPTTGLDPQSRRAFWDLVRQIRSEREVSVLLTTHYMEEAEVCDRIAIMDEGRVIALDTPAVLKSRVGGHTIALTLSGNGEAGAPPVFPYPAESQGDGRWRIVVPSAEEALPELVAALGGRIRSLDIHRPSLDDVFIGLTGKALREEEASTKSRMRDMLRLRGGRNR
ncbi:MAG TPA: ATP-binding cassette domain-containing protein, partial [bacterium]|nr:ATP-binding cassette domain-containing protein [bacterium]